MLEICMRCGSDLEVGSVADQDGTLCQRCFDEMNVEVLRG